MQRVVIVLLKAASFSRAIVEGLTAQLSDADFDKALDASIQSIYEASIK